MCGQYQCVAVHNDRTKCLLASDGPRLYESVDSNIARILSAGAGDTKGRHTLFFCDHGGRQTTPAGQTLTVKCNRGTTTAWRIDDEHGTEALPASAERCVKYGTSWRTGVTATAPTPLQYDVPYYADIETKVRFRVEFCLSQDVGGKAFLTKWAEDGNHCTRLPLKGPD